MLDVILIEPWVIVISKINWEWIIARHKAFGKLFAFNLGTQFIVNGKDADVYDATASTINPVFALVTNPLVDVKPLSTNPIQLYPYNKSHANAILDVSTGAVAFTLTSTVSTVSTPTVSQKFENVVNAVEEVVNKKANDQVNK